MDFGYARQGADVFGVSLASGGQGADVLRVDLDGGTQLAYVVREELNGLGQGFVAFREPIKAFVDGHGYLQFTVAGNSHAARGSCVVDSRPTETAPKRRTAAGLRPVDRRGRRSAGEGARPTAACVFFAFSGPAGGEARSAPIG